MNNIEIFDNLKTEIDFVRSLAEVLSVTNEDISQRTVVNLSHDVMNRMDKIRSLVESLESDGSR